MVKTTNELFEMVKTTNELFEIVNGNQVLVFNLGQNLMHLLHD